MEESRTYLRNSSKVHVEQRMDAHSARLLANSEQRIEEVARLVSIAQEVVQVIQSIVRC